MKIPVWTKPALWGVVIGAIGMAIVGFSQLGWTTASNADQLAQSRADTAVISALVPFCVTKAQADPDKATLVVTTVLPSKLDHLFIGPCTGMVGARPGCLSSS